MYAYIYVGFAASTQERRGKVVYVIINPSFDLDLEPGDIV